MGSTRKRSWCGISYVTSPRHPSVQGVPMTRSVSMLSSSSSAPWSQEQAWDLACRACAFQGAGRRSSTADPRGAGPPACLPGPGPDAPYDRYGILDEDKQRLDYVLALKIEDFMERRLQTLVFKRGLAKSIHHARVLIRQKHIRVGRQIVDIPSFMVRVESQPHIEFSLTSPFGGGRPGRVKRKSGGSGGDEDDE